MHEKFNDPVKAICYLASGLAEDFPNGKIQLAFQAGVRLKLMQCRTGEAAHLLELLCRKFRRVSVHYNPESESGTIGELHCHCEEDTRLKCCNHGKDRPEVLVRLIDAGVGALYPDTMTADLL